MKIFFQEDEKDEEEDSLSQEAAPGAKFRRGEDVPSDFEVGHQVMEGRGLSDLISVVSEILQEGCINRSIHGHCHRAITRIS